MPSQSAHVILDLELTGFKEGEYAVTEYNGPLHIGAMPNGTKTGNPTVMIAIENPDGSHGLMVAEITLAVFLAAADAFRAKYGDPRPA